jgi:hypothetical protein
MKIGKIPLSMLALFAVMVHFYFSIIEPCNAWGLDFPSYFPAWGIVVFYSLAALACFPFYNPRVQLFNVNLKTVILIAIGSFLYFYFVRYKYGLLGDNYLRVGQIIRGETWRNDFGTMIIMHQFYMVMHNLFNFDCVKSIHIFCALFGAGYSVYALLLSKEIGKYSIFIVLMVLPVATQFNGYIETYAVSIFLMIAFYYYSLLAMRARFSVFGLSVMLLIFAIIHLEILICFPAILFLIIRKIKNKTVATTLICVVGAALSIVFWPSFFHPLKELHDGRIPIFSADNFYAFLNGQVLSCGALVIGIVICLLNIFKLKFTSEIIMFSLVAGFQLLFFLCFDSILGAADWDLNSFSAIAITLAIIPCICQIGKYAVKIVVGLMLLNLGAWMILNSTDLSICRFVNIIKTDNAYYYRTHSRELITVLTFQSNGIK